MTVREDIVAAIVTAIGGGTPAGGRVYRDRPDLPVYTRDTLPAINVSKVSDDALNDTFIGGKFDWKLVVLIQVAATGAAPDSQVEATIAAVHTNIFADRTLGGKALEVLPGNVSFEYPEEHKEACVASCEYVVRYRTTETTL